MVKLKVVKLGVELKRKAFHLFGGLLIIYLIYNDFLNVSRFIAVIAAGAALCFLSRDFNMPFISWIIDNFEREKAKKSMPGKGFLYFISGCFIAYSLFSKDIALASVAILSVGDPVANMTRYHASKNSRLLGIAFATIVSAVAAMFFVNPTEAFAAALLAMSVESVEKDIGHDIWFMDDNILIPVAAAIMIFLIRLY